MTRVETMEQISRPVEKILMGNTDQVESSTGRAGKYLTFTMAEEDYGIGIVKVKEIIGMQDITAVPQTPGFVKGVINLRGKVIPVIDLRLRFGIKPTKYNERTCIIVVEIRMQVGTVQIGIVVDSVSEVMNIGDEEIEDAPTFGANLKTDYIFGMAKMDGGVKILLDIDCVFSEKDLEGLETIA
jgi:purine-binding chemotaxis protein CheW